jgi:hypothetical protein
MKPKPTPNPWATIEAAIKRGDYPPIRVNETGAVCLVDGGRIPRRLVDLIPHAQRGTAQQEANKRAARARKAFSAKTTNRTAGQEK